MLYQIEYFIEKDSKAGIIYLLAHDFTNLVEVSHLYLSEIDPDCEILNVYALPQVQILNLGDYVPRNNKSFKNNGSAQKLYDQDEPSPLEDIPLFSQSEIEGYVHKDFKFEAPEDVGCPACEARSEDCKYEILEFQCYCGFNFMVADNGWYAVHCPNCEERIDRPDIVKPPDGHYEYLGPEKYIAGWSNW